MTRLTATLLLLAGLAAATENSSVEGVWTASFAWDGRLRLTLERSTRNSSFRSTSEYDLSLFRGLPAARSGSLRREPVNFSLERDAGSFVFEGTFGSGSGAGTFSFSPSKAYAAELRKLGAGDITDERIFDLTIQDVSIDFIREVAATSPHFELRDVIKLRNHGVTADFLREARRAGYRDFTPDDYAKLRSFGVTSEFLAELKHNGYDLRADDITKLRSHGVDPGYLRALGSAGFAAQTDDIVALRSHGVPSEFVAAAQEAKMAFSTGDLVRLHDNGVNADYLRGLPQAGYGSLSASDIIRLRQNGVDPAYVQRIASAGLSNLSPEQIIKLRQHGVD